MTSYFHDSPVLSQPQLHPAIRKVLWLALEAGSSSQDPSAPMYMPLQSFEDSLSSDRPAELVRCV